MIRVGGGSSCWHRASHSERFTWWWSPHVAGEKFGVRGFPTLKWFPRGKPNDPEECAPRCSFGGLPATIRAASRSLSLLL